VILTLEVSGAHAASLGAERRHQFGTDGGFIGRARTCDWVLPHTKVSGRHARVTFSQGAFFIEDTSTNGVFVNSSRERLVRGRPHQLESGDRLFIDPYDIQVGVSDARSVRPSRQSRDTPIAGFGDSNPFDSNLFEANPFAGARHNPGAGIKPDLGVSEASSSAQELVPLKLIPGGPAPPPRRARSAHDLEGASPLVAHYQAPVVKTPPPVSAPSRSKDVIPEGYDPLADSGPTPLSAFTAPPVAPVERRPDPHPVPDPLFEELPEPERAPAREPSRKIPPAETPAPPDPVPATPLAPLAELAPAVEEWVPDVPVPEPPTPEAAAEPPAVEAPAPERPVVEPSRGASERRTPAVTARLAAAGDLRAVLAGAGLTDVDVTEELARDFGRILNVVVAGVMDVLRARQQIKDEFRMRLTQFRPADNNPLKFSANVEDALHNLLVKRNAAYLEPVEAFEDAFDDVRSHQLAMLAGMRVAFEAMLNEFNPDRLQEQFDHLPKGGSLLPAKMRYWELYRERSEKLVKDTETTFRRLFAESFAKAYEEQLARLREEQRRARRKGEPKT
jgi:type VI secretion system FHA domain protein